MADHKSQTTPQAVGVESLRALLLREWIESLEHPASLAWDDFVYAEIRRLGLVDSDGRIRRQSQ